MAVATPVLERKTTQSAEDETISPSKITTAEELHNARIRDNYARLIDPNLSLNEIRGEQVAPRQEYAPARASVAASAAAPVHNPIPVQPVQQVSAQSVQQARPVVNNRPYLVENARADAAIFRADSAVNARRQTVVMPEQNEAEEEESDDLRPTKTTIQYRTIEADKLVDAKDEAEFGEHVLGKREKIIISIFVGIVVALFTLVIINSAIIANLHTDMSIIQQSINEASAALDSVQTQISSITSQDSIIQFALEHGINLGR